MQVVVIGGNTAPGGSILAKYGGRIALKNVCSGKYSRTRSISVLSPFSLALGVIGTQNAATLGCSLLGKFLGAENGLVKADRATEANVAAQVRARMRACSNGPRMHVFGMRAFSSVCGLDWLRV